MSGRARAVAGTVLWTVGVSMAVYVAVPVVLALDWWARRQRARDYAAAYERARDYAAAYERAEATVYLPHYRRGLV